MTCGKCASFPKLSHPITVEKLKTTAVIDGSGNVNESLDSNWTMAGNEWAEIITKGSREFFRGQQVGEDITHQVTIRATTQSLKYTTKMRVKFEGRKLVINSPPVNIDEDKSGFVRMACTETPVL